MSKLLNCIDSHWPNHEDSLLVYDIRLQSWYSPYGFVSGWNRSGRVLFPWKTNALVGVYSCNRRVLIFIREGLW